MSSTAERTTLFHEQGYLVVEDVIPLPLVREMRNVASQLGGENERRIAWSERGLLRHRCFRDLVRTPKLLALIEELLGGDFKLLGLDLRRTRPERGAIHWHRDATFVCNKTLSVNTAIYLQDTPLEMGPLRVVPGTQRIERVPSPHQSQAGEQVLAVPAGAVVFHDGGVWHSGSPNRSSDDCWSIFPFFGKYWISRMDTYFTQPLPVDITASSDPIVRQLFGLGLKDESLSYHGDTESYNRRGEEGVDYLSGQLDPRALDLQE